MREQDIHRKIKAYLKSEGWAVWKNHGSAYSESGLPDLMALRDGIFLAVEVKRPGYPPTALQSLWLRRIEEHGGIGFVADSVRECEVQLAAKLSGRRPGS